jgi:hypothetical protein
MPQLLGAKVMGNDDLPSIEEARMIAQRFGAHAFHEANGAAREQRLPARRVEQQPLVRRTEEPFERETVDEIAELLRTLTYGEMIELADGLWDARSLGDISRDALPALLHRWALSRK